ncbi:hypothetical protein GLA29479_3297 [Lysobacter antibioticus]|nr:hypothetical protein GLA29479_3297 [Lysobacter antibioticus]
MNGLIRVKIRAHLDDTNTSTQETCMRMHEPMRLIAPSPSGVSIA